MELFAADGHDASGCERVTGKSGMRPAAEACETDYVAFLNNDTRVETTWLAELLAVQERQHATAVASKMLDWTGERIDFAGGIVSVVGHCWQRDTGEPAAKPYNEECLLFGCGGSLLVSRDAFIDVGGFDPEFFAYFEDVDLGWRMSLMGYTTVFAPNAVTYHKVHGTAGRWPLASRLRLYERNALMMIYKNYETRTLARVLPVAVALSLARAAGYAAIAPSTFDFGQPVPNTWPLPARAVAHLIALEDFGRMLPTLATSRQQVQRRRKRSDVDLLPLFGDPLHLHDISPEYARIGRVLFERFGITQWLAETVEMAEVSHPGGVESARPVGPVEGATPSSRPCPGRRDEALEPARPTHPGDELPAVTIVVLVAAGPVHLPECLASLRAHDYPSDRCEVIVVDNGSPEDPTGVVTREYPGARVLRNEANLGFAAGNNVGARAATTPYLVFLNDDTRVHPEWLREMVGAVRRHAATCVASQILTWDGRRIDFAGGSVNVEGRGFQVEIGAEPQEGGDDTPLLFGCGAALLVERHAFLNAGGWDEDTFAYYEDVELGWRFWLLGYEVWLAPRALVYHKHHGTAGASSGPARARLYERNALRMLYTHLETRNLERVLPAALLLAADRVLLQTRCARTGLANESESSGRRPTTGAPAVRFKRDLVARGAARHLSVAENLRRVGAVGLLRATWTALSGTVTVPRPSAAVEPRTAYLMEAGVADAALDDHAEVVPASAAAVFAGFAEFVHSLPHLDERRRWLQSKRQRSDAEILSRFASQHWLQTSPAVPQRPHDDLHALLVRQFGLDGILLERDTDGDPDDPVSDDGLEPSAGSDDVAALAQDLREIVDNTRRGVETLENEGRGVLDAVHRMRGSRVRRVVRRTRDLASVMVHPVRAMGAFGSRVLAVSPGHRMLDGWRRVRYLRLPLRHVDSVRQETDQLKAAEALHWVGPITIRNVERDSLFSHPTSSIEFGVPAWPDSRVVAWCGLLPQAWLENTAGVDFAVTVAAQNGAWRREHRVRVDPRHSWGDRRWHRVSIALPPTVTGTVQVTLATRLPPQGDPSHAAAVWGDPALIRAYPLRQLWQTWQTATVPLGLTGMVRRLRQLGTMTEDQAHYQQWVAANAPRQEALRGMAATVNQLAYRPRISIITPVYNTESSWLRACIESVRRQAYPDWELCLCDDGSDSAGTRQVLTETETDPRIRVVRSSENRGISAASNAALEVATGDFVAMLDHDDELTPDALYEVARALNDHPDVDMLYSDEDKLDPNGQRSDPFFKPDWSPDHFLSCMYTCHLMVLRRSLVERLGGFRLGYEGSQDYDLVLRIIGRTSRIRHIPKVLYHWRKVTGSAAASAVAKPWATDSGRRAIEDHLRRENMAARVESGATPGQYRVRYDIDRRHRVSIVFVATESRRPIGESEVAMLNTSLRVIADKTTYEQYEVIVVHDGSLRDANLERPHPKTTSLACRGDGPPPLADRLNLAVDAARGDHIVVCCGGIEPNVPDWIDAMLEYSQQPAVGAVGPKLRYPDGRLCHVGLVLGGARLVRSVFHGWPGSSHGYISSAVSVRNYSAVSGQCLMTRRDVIREIGGFDPAFGNLADVDYCLRADMRGYRVVFTPHADLSVAGPAADTHAFDTSDAEEAMRGSWGHVLRGDPHYNPNLSQECLDYRPRVGISGVPPRRDTVEARAGQRG